MTCDVGSTSFSNLYIASPTSQLILQPFRCFTYVIGTSPASPGEPPMPLWWCLIYPWWFCNLQWLRPAGLYERCKLALELKRLKTPALDIGPISVGPQPRGPKFVNSPMVLCVICHIAASSSCGSVYMSIFLYQILVPYYLNGPSSLKQALPGDQRMHVYIQ